jgi:hypothetical protein
MKCEQKKVVLNKRISMPKKDRTNAAQRCVVIKHKRGAVPRVGGTFCAPHNTPVPPLYS